MFLSTFHLVSRVLGSHRFTQGFHCGGEKDAQTRIHTLFLFHRRSEEGGQQPPNSRDLSTEQPTGLTEEDVSGLGNLSSRGNTSQRPTGMAGSGIPLILLFLLTNPQMVVHSTLTLFIKAHINQAFCLPQTPSHFHQDSHTLPTSHHHQVYPTHPHTLQHRSHHHRRLRKPIECKEPHHTPSSTQSHGHRTQLHNPPPPHHHQSLPTHPHTLHHSRHHHRRQRRPIECKGPHHTPSSTPNHGHRTQLPPDSGITSRPTPNPPSQKLHNSRSKTASKATTTIHRMHTPPSTSEQAPGLHSTHTPLHHPCTSQLPSNTDPSTLLLPPPVPTHPPQPPPLHKLLKHSTLFKPLGHTGSRLTAWKCLTTTGTSSPPKFPARASPGWDAGTSQASKSLPRSTPSSGT